MRIDASAALGRRHRSVGALCAGFMILASTGGTAWAGPTSALYLTDYAATVHVVQGDAVINSWADRAGGGIDSLTAIAVGETVRTYPQGLSTDLPSQGAEYTLDGTFTGALYSNTVGCCFRDGTTDGVHNYAVRASAIEPLYRFNRDWGDPEVLELDYAGTSELGPVTGITFDPRNGSFWLVDHGVIFNVTLAGDVLSFFVTGTGNLFDQALAFDPADSTLWLTSYENYNGVLRQYDPSAGLPTMRSALDTVVLPGLYVAGAEFAITAVAPVPEPATWALLIIGFAAAGARLRSRRAAMA